MVRNTVSERKILNTQPLLSVGSLPRGCYIHQHQLRETQEGIQRSTLRAQSVYLLGDDLNLIVEVHIGLGVVSLAALC